MFSNTVECFDLDIEIYNNIFKKSPRIIEKVKEYKEVINNFESLSEDIYLSLFKAKPVIKNSNDITVEYKHNLFIINKLFETNEFQALRKLCVLKNFDSILGADLLGTEIGTRYKKLCQENEEFQNQLKELEAVTKLDLSSEIIEKKVNKIIDNIGIIITKNNLIYRSVTFAYKEFLSITNTIKAWGLTDNKLNPTSYEEKLEVSSKLKKLKKVKEIAEMAGRFKASASRLQRKKTKEEGQEICGVKLGNEIHKMLPSEKLLLTKEVTKKSFYKKYTQKELLSYKYKNNRSKSKGPIICCIDTSSSMEGELEVWSKSVAITLLDIAFKQKRDFVAILFSYKVGKTIEFSMNKIEAPKIYELATTFYGSGTNFIEPLNESIKLINSTKYKYSDIIFITDGKAPIDEEFIEYFNAQKKEKEFRMITVNVSEEIEEALNQINDVQLLLKELTEETIDDTNEVLFSI